MSIQKNTARFVVAIAGSGTAAAVAAMSDSVVVEATLIGGLGTVVLVLAGWGVVAWLYRRRDTPENEDR